MATEEEQLAWAMRESMASAQPTTSPQQQRPQPQQYPMAHAAQHTMPMGHVMAGQPMMGYPQPMAPVYGTTAVAGAVRPGGGAIAPGGAPPSTTIYSHPPGVQVGSVGPTTGVNGGGVMYSAPVQAMGAAPMVMYGPPYVQPQYPMWGHPNAVNSPNGASVSAVPGQSTAFAPSPSSASSANASSKKEEEEEKAEEYEWKPPSITKAATWEPNSATKSCRLCDKGFSSLVRRHHCRACGGLMCAGCTRGRMVLPWLAPNNASPNRAMAPVRVCKKCREHLEKQGLPASEADEERMLQEALAASRQESGLSEDNYANGRSEHRRAPVGRDVVSHSSNYPAIGQGHRHADNNNHNNRDGGTAEEDYALQVALALSKEEYESGSGNNNQRFNADDWSQQSAPSASSSSQQQQQPPPRYDVVRPNGKVQFLKLRMLSTHGWGKFENKQRLDFDLAGCVVHSTDEAFVLNGKEALLEIVDPQKPLILRLVEVKKSRTLFECAVQIDELCQRNGSSKSWFALMPPKQPIFRVFLELSVEGMGAGFA